MISVGLTDGKKKDILLATALGMAIRFSEEDVRPMGLVAAGVNGMKLDDKDEVAGMEIFPIDGEALLMTSDGKAKRIESKEFPSQGRYGKGVSVWSLSEKVKLVGIVSGKPNEVATIHMSKGAAKSTRTRRGCHPQTRCDQRRCAGGSEARRGSDERQRRLDGGEVCEDGKSGKAYEEKSRGCHKGEAIKESACEKDKGKAREEKVGYKQ